MELGARTKERTRGVIDSAPASRNVRSPQLYRSRVSNRVSDCGTPAGLVSPHAIACPVEPIIVVSFKYGASVTTPFTRKSTSHQVIAAQPEHVRRCACRGFGPFRANHLDDFNIYRFNDAHRAFVPTYRRHWASLDTALLCGHLER